MAGDDRAGAAGRAREAEIAGWLLAPPVSLRRDFRPVSMTENGDARTLSNGEIALHPRPGPIRLPAPAVFHLPRPPDGRAEAFAAVEYDVAPPGVARLENCLVMGHRFVVLDSDRRPLEESIPTFLGARNPRWFERDVGTLERLAGRPVVDIDEPAALLANGNWRNYWHWHAQSLPNIDLLRRAGLYPGVRLLGPELSEWRAASLDFLGVRREDVVADSGTRIFRLRELYYPSYLDKTQMWFQSPELIRCFDGIAAALRAEAGDETPELLYISRLDSRRRRLVNEEELADALEALGFVAVIPGELDYRRQVAMASRARVIVGLHGAGLTNLVFSPLGSTVVEIMPEYWYKEEKSVFRVLAQLKGSKYSAIVSHRCDAATMNWRLDADAAAAIVRDHL
jgi:capsular polysaccharide biosynthesis protein